MTKMDRVRGLWERCTQPRSKDEDDARREYVTKSMLLSLAIVAGVFLGIAFVGNSFRVIPPDTTVYLAVMVLASACGWWLSHRGWWRFSGYLPPFLTFLGAVYGNWIGGIDAPAMLLYVIAILVTALLQGGSAPMVTLFLSLAAFLGLASAHYYGYIQAYRTSGTAFANRVTIVIAALIAITVLLNLLVTQFRKAIERSRGHESRARANANTLAIFKTLADNAVDAFLMSDLDGRLIYANRMFYKIFRFASDSATEMDVGAFFPKGLLKEAGLDTSQDGFQGWKGEVLLKRADGTEFDADLSVFRLRDIDGEPKGKAVIVRDVTERNRAQKALLESESQLRHAQKMEAVGELAGGVAHDFNNILQAILGYSDLARSHDGLSPELDEIVKAAERASLLTRQLLAFSRRQVIEPAILDLNEVIENLLRMIRRMIGERIELTFCPATVLEAVFVDRGQIEQVLMNLCVNARDAMPEGGRLSIETCSRRFEETDCPEYEGARPGDWVILIVRDTGHGMDAEVMSRIFEPFFTTKAAGQGTGLGLAMVYGIIKQHGGFIGTESSIGKGTAFTIGLPAVNDSPSRPSSVPKATPRGGTETILLAEDEEQVRTQTTLVLESAGYTVMSAVNGKEAIRLYDEHAEEISLLVLDAVMPKLDGRAVYDYVRQTRPDVHCLFSTGYSQDSLKEIDFSKSPPYLLQKPYHPQELLTLVRSILDS